MERDEHFRDMIMAVWGLTPERPVSCQSSILQSPLHSPISLPQWGHGSSAEAGILPGTISPIARSPSPKPLAPEPPMAVQQILAVVKSALMTRGIRGFIGLQRIFRNLDLTGRKILNLADFKKAIKNARIDLSDTQTRQVFHFYDTDGTGTINFEFFLSALRRPLSAAQKKMVADAYSRILGESKNSVAGHRYVDAALMADRFDAGRHPDVIARRRNEKAVYQEFLATFDVGGNGGGKVTPEEFEEYYANVWASTEDSEWFEALVRNSWPSSPSTSSSSTYARSPASFVSSPSHTHPPVFSEGGSIPLASVSKVNRKMVDFEEPVSKPANDRRAGVVIKKLKNQLKHGGGTGYRNLQRAFRMIDIDDNKVLDKKEFEEGMIKLGLSMDGEELQVFLCFFQISIQWSLYFCSYYLLA